jgi:hypothetical protein
MIWSRRLDLMWEPDCKFGVPVTLLREAYRPLGDDGLR